MDDTVWITIQVGHYEPNPNDVDGSIRKVSRQEFGVLSLTLFPVDFKAYWELKRIFEGMLNKILR